MLQGTSAPGILTAKTLQNILSGSMPGAGHQETSGSDIVSPYGTMPRPPRKSRSRYRSNDLNFHQVNLRLKHDVIAKRKRCRKLDPMPAAVDRAQDQAEMSVSLAGNQVNGGDTDHDVPNKQYLERLRLGLRQTSTKQQWDSDRLKNDIQWIHGHFPVLKLANSKCSRALRYQLYRDAIIRVSIHFMLRKALLCWYHKLLEAQRKERLQLSASRRLITMFEKVSYNRVVIKFDWWRRWILECQHQETLAATITLQRFARFLHCQHLEREFAEQQVALMQALQRMQRSARAIQGAYRHHRQDVQQRRCEAAARRIQRLEMRRAAHNRFIKSQNAAKVLQRGFRAHAQRRSCRRERALALFLDRSRERQAQRIQNAWFDFKRWRDYDLPLEISRALVDQVEFLDAVLSIQRHLRGFQCRIQIRKANNSALRIQKCWRTANHRMAARAERRVVIRRRDVAASYLQRAFRQKREEHKIRCIVRQSTRPLYLRALHFGESFREQFKLPIAKSAIAVIQSTWRRHVTYEKEKQRKLVAATTIQQFIKRGSVLTKWRYSVLGARRRRRENGARTLQHWIRRLRHDQNNLTTRRNSVVYVLEQISAATLIQQWYRHRHNDTWRLLLARLLTHELPRCNEAVNIIAHCWKAYTAKKTEQMRRASTLADLIEQQRRSEVQNRAARFIQRMFQRMIDRRDGKLLLHRYKILLREDLKRRQQRVIVHKYLQEKTQERVKKQEAKAVAVKTRRASVKPVNNSAQMSLDSTAEASAFSLDNTSYYTSDSDWQGLSTDSVSPQTGSPVQYWSDEYQRAYLYDPVTGVSTWL
ncbi:unnamed protein product [Phytophthora lilii]|uniref:Unnamed protein product n=1 Tax=Phytophthora lilii TaxID=2077276 RepID=A0A9W6TK51_9STRA|nr:unnamed protein product [Phytophthora lilii]